jgi:hypothetical protein
MRGVLDTIRAAFMAAFVISILLTPVFIWVGAIALLMVIAKAIFF